MHLADLLVAADSRVLAEPGAPLADRYMISSLIRQAGVVRGFVRARRQDRKLLGATARENLRWGLRMCLPSLRFRTAERDAVYDFIGSSNRHLAAAAPMLLGSRLGCFIQAELGRLQRADFAKHPPLLCGLEQLERLMRLRARLRRLPSHVRQGQASRHLAAGLQKTSWLVRSLIADYADGYRLSRLEEEKLLWLAVRASAWEAAVATLELPAHRRQSEALGAYVDAHRRLLARHGLEAGQVPVVVVSDRRWLDQVELQAWRFPARQTKTKALCLSGQLVLLGPEEARTARKLMERGWFSPTIMHELLHAAPSKPAGGNLPSEVARWVDHAIYEGAQQCAAEELCIRGSDPTLGLKGGRRHPVIYRGWKELPRLLARLLEADALGVALRLARAGRRRSLSELALLCGLDDRPQTLHRLAVILEPPLRRAYEHRRERGIGQQTRAELERIFTRLLGSPTQTPAR